MYLSRLLHECPPCMGTRPYKSCQAACISKVVNIVHVVPKKEWVHCMGIFGISATSRLSAGTIPVGHVYEP